MLLSLVPARHRIITKSQRLEVGIMIGIMPTGGTAIEERSRYPEMAEETVQGARTGKKSTQTEKIGHGVRLPRGGGGDRGHLHQTPGEEIREKRSDAHAGVRARLDPLAISRTMAATTLHGRETLPTPPDPTPFHHQIPIDARSGALADQLLCEIIGLDRETEHIDRSIIADHPHPAPRIHLNAP